MRLSLCSWRHHWRQSVRSDITGCFSHSLGYGCSRCFKECWPLSSMLWLCTFISACLALLRLI